MKTFKWLTGLTLASFFTLIVAWFSSLMLNTGSEFYLALGKPKYLPSDDGFSLIWFFVFLFNILAAARLVIKRRFAPDFLMVSAMWAMALGALFSLFQIENVAAAFTLTVVTLIFSYINLARMLHIDLAAGLFFLPITIWISFLFILMTGIVVLNH
ncbi:MAG TPA: tryptophan-rich sensory protein [Eubacteriales bacterium]|jgi:tryptophan-rich sensory protein|nr:tryptophan-rich sensory protein [Clostridia bacterium]HRR89689.1 tryptophan-rich sensory protein [Eubacteriales bacterium]HRU84302.1 tryptophan-rich sensory protein [Eubacteriales bacterium]